MRDVVTAAEAGKRSGKANSDLMGAVRMLLGVGLLILGSGCETIPLSPPPASAVPEALTRLVPGEEIEVAFMGAPNLNTTQKIRRDGKISLQLMGEVQAAGKTPGELRKEIGDLAASQLQIKDVSVVVRTPAPVFVSGAVHTPGRVELTSPLNVLQAISEAGGFDLREAEVRNVVVIRYEASQRHCYSFNFLDTLQGKEDDADKPFYLMPLDIVYVPRTRITRVDQWVEQHINKLLPSLGLGYSPPGSSVAFSR